MNIIKSAISHIYCRYGSIFHKVDVEAILKIAKHNVGFDAFESEEFLIPLQILAAALDKEAKLSLRGREMVRWWIINCLSNRLCIENYVLENPDAEAENIVAPTIVVGLPRSGTTFLYNLLSRDADYQWFTTWEAAIPVWPAKFGDDVRRAITIERLAHQDLVAPKLKSIHNSEADAPEECQVLLQNTFKCEVFPLALRVPTYSAWLNTQNRVDSYNFYLKQLKIFQHQKKRKRWLLKSPTHMFSLEALLNVIPDARIIFIKRDPIEALPSACNLSYTLRRQFSDIVSKREIGLEMKKQFEIANAKADSILRGLNKGRMAIVNYAEFIANPMSTIDNIYDDFGLKLSKSRRELMSLYSQEQSARKRPAHLYSLKEFGLDPVALGKLQAPPQCTDQLLK